MTIYRVYSGVFASDCIDRIREGQNESARMQQVDLGFWYSPV